MRRSYCWGLVACWLFTWPQLGMALSDEEMKFGFHVDRGVLSQQVLVLHEAVNTKINAIGARLAKAAGKTDIQHTFRVVNDPTINAYSAAGGFVYVTTGLLDILESEDELAAVLAHELHHTNASHQINTIYAARRSEVAGRIAGTALYVVVGAGFAMLGAKTAQAGYTQAAPQVTEVGAKLGSGLGGLLGKSVTVSMVQGYGKDRELEADAQALQYLKKAGYDPKAFIRVLHRLISIRDQLEINEKNYTSSLINAEPGLEERLKTVESHMTRSP